METNNETIDDIIKDILENDGMCISPTSLFVFDEDGGILLGDLAERIKVAHEREIAAKDAEIVRLRALVKELANELDLKTCHTVCDLYCTKCYQKDCEDLENRALIAKAREVCK